MCTSIAQVAHGNWLDSKGCHNKVGATLVVARMFVERFLWAATRAAPTSSQTPNDPEFLEMR